MEAPTDRLDRREIAARTNSSQVKSSQVKSSQVKLKSLVSGGSNRREGRKRDVLPMHTFGTIVLPASHPLSPLPLKI